MKTFRLAGWRNEAKKEWWEAGWTKPGALTKPMLNPRKLQRPFPKSQSVCPSLLWIRACLQGETVTLASGLALSHFLFFSSPCLQGKKLTRLAG